MQRAGVCPHPVLGLTRQGCGQLQVLDVGVQCHQGHMDGRGAGVSRLVWSQESSLPEGLAWCQSGIRSKLRCGLPWPEPGARNQQSGPRMPRAYWKDPPFAESFQFPVLCFCTQLCLQNPNFPSRKAPAFHTPVRLPFQAALGCKFSADLHRGGRWPVSDCTT